MKIYIKVSLTLGLLCLFGQLWAQVPMPAPEQQFPTYIVNGTLHIGNGEVLENGIVAFENGKITIVATPETLGKVNLSRYQIIDAKGKHIYPGFIAPNSNLGLVEIGAVRPTRDNSETGYINPNIRSIIAYNTDSEVIPTIRSRGVLLAQITPEGGLVSGMSSIVHLDAWNWEDAAIVTDDGIHMNWPSTYSYNWRSRQISQNDRYGEQVDQIDQLMAEAKAYTNNKNLTETNLKFEAMRPLFSNNRQLFIHVNNAKSMTTAILLAKKYGVKAVIVGGSEAWMITDLLKENNVAVILSRTHRLPSQVDEDIDQPFKTPALLAEAEVLFCLQNEGNWQQRNLPFQAGHAVGFGLAYEKAVQSISLNTAKILGIDDKVGSIEVGKDATLFISTGDALDMRSSAIEQAFIEGRSIDLNNKQKGLYEKFKKKYNEKR
jgi:imidazolonepropionase-like amidohydrolase